MIGLWWFTRWLPKEPWLDRMGLQCRFTNAEELSCAWSKAGELAPANFPIARLELTIEKFSLDCFCWQAYTLVSQDLRDAMALGPRDVHYFPVDSSLSAPLPRSKNYMIMHIPVVEKVSDPDRSDYHYTSVGGSEVGTFKKVMLADRIAMRREAKPKHELFSDSFFSGYLFCTEDFAVRVLKGEYSGMRFVDPGYMGNPMRFRSLRGIEEERWHSQGVVSHTRLVRAIS